MRLLPTKVILTIIAVLIVTISTVSYTLSALVDANQKVTQDITNFSRGAYDILIRPPDAQTELEKQLNLIEENYLGLGEGGITIEQWQEIKNHSQVEIAAPVASVGLFAARERTFMISREPLDANYYEIEYSTNDGINTYSSLEKTYVYDFGFENEEYKIYPSSLSAQFNYLGTDVASFGFPVSYHQVVAVDPEEEGKLTGLNLEPLTDTNLLDEQAYEAGRYSIPIMSLSDVSVPVSIKVTIDNLSDISEEDKEKWSNEFIDGNPFLTLDKDPDRYQKVIEEFISKKRLFQEENYHLTPETNHSPFEQMLLYTDEKMNLKLQSPEDAYMLGFGGAWNYHSQRIGYRLDPIVYDVLDNSTLSVQQVGVDEVYEAPIYRDIEEVEFYEVDEYQYPVSNEDYLGFIQNGTFSIRENTDSLSSAPLGIYGGELPYLATDPSMKLHPSAVPGSFITTPAHGLVSIDYVEKVKGEAPIDAIRVKVAGINGYDKEAATLIRQLASEWREKGFTVDIVAGASLQDLIVNVEGIGEVVQSFTTLGAADTVVTSWNAMQAALTILYGLVVLTFVGFTFFNLLSDRQKDEQLLVKLGWPEKLINRLRYKELGIILGVPITLILISFVVLGFWKNQWSPLIFSIFVSLAYALLFFIIDRLRKTKKRLPKKQGNSIIIQNILFYSNHLFASYIQLFFMTILTCFLPFFLIQNVDMTIQTRLGSYIHGNIEGIFIVVVIMLYILSLTTVYQSLSRMWNKRKSEIQLFFILGWGTKTIRSYFLKEVFISAGLSIVIGWLVSVFIIIMTTQITTLTILLSIIGFVLIFAVTLIGSIHLLNRINLKEAGLNENRTS